MTVEKRSVSGLDRRQFLKELGSAAAIAMFAVSGISETTLAGESCVIIGCGTCANAWCPNGPVELCSDAPGWVLCCRDCSTGAINCSTFFPGCGGGGGCFVAGTLIATVNGPVSIEEIKIDSEIYSMDWQRFSSGERQIYQVDSGKLSTQSVTAIHEFYEPDIYILIFNKEEIHCTPGHRFFTNLHQWTPAKDLKEGDNILDMNGDTHELIGVKRERQPQTVFNFDVEPTQNFFVGESALQVSTQK